MASIKKKITEAEILLSQGNILETIDSLIEISKFLNKEQIKNLNILRAKYLNTMSMLDSNDIAETTTIRFQNEIIDELYTVLEKINDLNIDTKTFDKYIKIPSVKEFFILFLPVVIGVLLIVVMQFTIPKIRDANLKHKYFYIENINKLDPPTIDGVIFTEDQWRYATTGTYSVHSSHFESDAVKEIRKKFPELKGLTQNKSFYGLYSLCTFLLKENEYEKEFEILQFFVNHSESSKLKDNSNISPYRDFYDYIRYNYINFGVALFKRNQFKEASFYIQEAYRRLALIDTPPYKFDSRINLNNVILFKALLDCEEEILINYNLIQDLTFDWYGTIHFNWENIDLSKIDRNISPKLFLFSNYLKGTRELENNRYESAYHYFKISSQAKNMDLIRELSILCTARTYYWEFLNDVWDKRDDIEKDQVLSRIHILEKNLRNIRKSQLTPNFLSDLDYYISQCDFYRETLDFQKV